MQRHLIKAWKQVCQKKKKKTSVSSKYFIQKDQLSKCVIIFLSDCYVLNFVSPTHRFICYCLVTKLCLTLCDPLDWSMPGFPVLHYLLEFVQTHVHWVSGTIQPSHLLSSPSLLALNLPQHQSLFQWVGSSHQMAKVLELQLQYQSFQWKFRVDFL